MRTLTFTLIRLAVTAAALIGWPGLLLALAAAFAPAAEAPLWTPRHGQPLTRQTALLAVWVAAWALWLVAVAAAVAHLRRWIRWVWRGRPRLHVPGPVQGLSAALLGAVAVSSSATPALAIAATASAPAADGHDLTGPAAVPERLAGHPDAAHGPVARVPATPTARSTTACDVVYGAGRPTVQVQRGDALWRIAGRCLRNPLRWRQIYRLSAARYDRHGQMHGGAHVEPGWILTLPTDTARTPTPGRGRSRPHPSVPRQTPLPRANPRPAGDGGPHPAMPGPSTSPANQPSQSATAVVQPARRCATPGVQLPSGSWIDLGLAAAITAAAAAVWRHRRRQYVPRPPRGAVRDDPDLVPLPPVVAQAEAGLRHPTAGEDDGDLLPDLPDDLGPAWGGVGTGLDVVQHSPAGLGLTGPDASAAARGLLVAALADDASGTQVVIPAATATALLGPAALPGMPRLHAAKDFDDAMRLLEEQILHRTRLLDDQDNKAAGPGGLGPDGEPLVPLLLLAESPAAAGGLAALLHQGHRLRIHGLLVGAWPAGTTLAVASDGTTTSADGHRPIDVAARLSVLDAGETLDLLGTLAEVHTGHPPTTEAIQSAPP